MGNLFFYLFLPCQCHNFYTFVAMKRCFYTRPDVPQIACDLLGKMLFTCFDGVLTAGMIVETEAYCGKTDAACHAYPNRYTARTHVMYEQGGRAYVYWCYGMHRLFNVVTNEAGCADAVLIRAIEPSIGIDAMLQRRQMKQLHTRLTAGPACVAQALGIEVVHSGIDLLPDKQATANIWIADAPNLPKDAIAISTRIGIEGAGAAAIALPWRFYIANNKWVSGKKSSPNLQI